jgi:hypothetical protein
VQGHQLPAPSHLRQTLQRRPPLRQKPDRL